MAMKYNVCLFCPRDRLISQGQKKRRMLQPLKRLHGKRKNVPLVIRQNIQEQKNMEVQLCNVLPEVT